MQHPKGSEQNSRSVNDWLPSPHQVLVSEREWRRRTICVYLHVDDLLHSVHVIAEYYCAAERHNSNTFSDTIVLPEFSSSRKKSSERYLLTGWIYHTADERKERTNMQNLCANQYSSSTHEAFRSRRYRPSEFEPFLRSWRSL